eukprot:m.1003356 g.1003356  ORF g.1003356 m.1003356 type:complete len:121 (-) comp24043_c0_seq7:4135-4497(-)
MSKSDATLTYVGNTYMQLVLMQMTILYGNELEVAKGLDTHSVMKQTCDNFNSSSCVPDTDCGCVSFHTYAVNRKLTRALGAIVGFSSVHFILMCIWTTLFSLWKDEVTAETSSSYTAIEN